MPTVTDTIFIDDALGNRLEAPRDWVRAEYVRAENGVGALSLTLPSRYPKSLFKKDGAIEIWRSVDGGQPYLDTGTVWQIRRPLKVIKGSQRLWRINCFDLNHLLKRRVVDYAAGSAQADQSRAADDLGKQIVRENQGSSATDTSRSWATYLDVQANATAGPTVTKKFSERNVLTVLQEIAQASFNAGTYLVFDTVCSVPPGSGSAMKFEFRSYTGQRGVDHRFPGGNPPLLIGPDFGNLDDIEYQEDAENEITRAIVGGQGQQAARAFRRKNDTTRQGESPFALIEAFQNATGEASTAGLDVEADALLKSGRPRRTLTGQIVPTSGLIYGVHYNWGDYVTAQVDGDSFDAHLNMVHVTRTRDEHEEVEIWARSEA